MDLRQQRGLQIARTSRIRRNKGDWIVPSQSGNGNYKVTFYGFKPKCTCPDCKLRRTKCKHIWAVEYVKKQEIDMNGNEKTTEAVRVTYSQNWPAYNKAQCSEKALFMELLASLCKEIKQPDYGFGRPKLPLSDMVFCSAFKVYSLRSGRRFTTDMKIAQEKGYISQVPHYNSIFNYLKRKELMPILKDLIEKSSLPLKTIETDFAVDSSGFSTCRFERWYNFKYGKRSNRRIWLKTHLMCGVSTNIVTSIEITEGKASDCKMLPELVTRTSRNFDIREVSADKAYSSRKNLKVINEVGGVGYIPYRSNATGRADGSYLWSKMFRYFMYRREEFMQHYHKRSNVETTFHMIKSKFGDSLRSKDPKAQVNEILCKVLCHNICVLVQEMHELGFLPNFLN